MTNQSPFTTSQLDKIRENFPHIDHGHTYLNHAAIAPLSIKVKKALDQFISERHEGPIENYEHGMEISQNTRELIARYLNAPNPEQITYTGNTSEGISAVAEGLIWNEGDEIILNDMEFPTNVHPFRALSHKGVGLNILKSEKSTITVEQIESAITKRTRLISISAVQFLHGFKADLKSIGAICNEHDIIFVVDAIQCLGAMPIDVQECNIDALATGGHKWLMSPLGTGFLYTSENLANEMRPPRTGWLSVEEPWELFNYDQAWLPFAQHMEVGTPNMLGITGMNAALNTMFDVGLKNITSQILYLTNHLMNQIKSIPDVELINPSNEHSRLGIVTFRASNHQKPDEIVQRMKQKKITISAREGLFRISPHFYNTTDEIDKALGELF